MIWKHVNLRSVHFLVWLFSLAIENNLAKDTDSNSSPGLWAEYRSRAFPDVPPLKQVDAKPSFNWGGSTPHPRLPPGPFVVTWQGEILLDGEDGLSFFAFVAGELKLAIDGTDVLTALTSKDGRVDSTSPLKRPPGRYSFNMEFRSLDGVPARVQLWWSGKSFSPEPVPSHRFSRTTQSLNPEWELEFLRGKGRKWAWQFGCAQCHESTFPGIKTAPAISLKDLGERTNREWLVQWLENPQQFLPHARMPSLFAPSREGFVERHILAEKLIEWTRTEPAPAATAGDHRAGRQTFVGLGCAACHPLPEDNSNLAQQTNRNLNFLEDRIPLIGLSDRYNHFRLTRFLVEPDSRFHDGRMPKFPMTDSEARDVAAYLLLWSPPSRLGTDTAPPTSDEIKQLADRLGTSDDLNQLGLALLKGKGCAACHSGLPVATAPDIAIRSSQLEEELGGCLDQNFRPGFKLDKETGDAIRAYARVAPLEKHSSPFDKGRRHLELGQCFRCHQGDHGSVPPLEQHGKDLWVPHLMRLPYQRSPRLTHATSKFNREHLAKVLGDGITAVRPSWYSYKMPLYQEKAEAIIEALAAMDGDILLPASTPGSTSHKADPSLHNFGSSLAGFEGYACVSCHLWKGRELTHIDPGSIGPELTTVAQRVQREWFNRWIENPPRLHPGTPMPVFFEKGKAAPITSMLDGDSARQIDALWALFSMGTNAPDLQPRPSIPILSPPGAQGPVVAQIPIALDRGETLESISLQHPGGVLIYSITNASPHSYHHGSHLLRNPNGWRTFTLSKPEKTWSLATESPISVMHSNGEKITGATRFSGYELLEDGTRLHFQWKHSASQLQFSEEIRLPAGQRVFIRQWNARGMPDGSTLSLKIRLPGELLPSAAISNGLSAIEGSVKTTLDHDILTLSCRASPNKAVRLSFSIPLPPPAQSLPATPKPVTILPIEKPRLPTDGSLERPGYRAIQYRMPQTSENEDAIMPAALAVDPSNNRVFIASLKFGELFVLDDPNDNGIGAIFRDYARGLFQDAYAMHHDGAALYLLHRRNLTRILDLNQDGFADRFERAAELHQHPGNTYDWAYGIPRDRGGRFILSFAPHADNKAWPGMGGIIRLEPGADGFKPVEIGSGLRNAVGWTAGPEGEIFFTDNQGEWVPANKLCHVMEGHNYGYPNSNRPDLAKVPRAPAAVWVPYDWAKSINGVTYDPSEGKFGPFSGQLFMAELMNGGAIIRANVEMVNGIYQGACFPFWGKGLLGPLSFAFDNKGRLYVGSITQPGWMAQPDRGALYRIEFTGITPFEIQSIHVRPAGFKIVFTKPVDPGAATSPGAYSIEHYRYEFSAAYGSPELDRTRLRIDQAKLDGEHSVELATGPLLTNRIYSITAGAVRSRENETLVHPTGVYTLNTLPKQ